MLGSSDLAKDLVFPLVVLLTSILFTGVLIPVVTDYRDRRRKAREIKTDLVSQMSEAVMEFMMPVELSALGSVNWPLEDHGEGRQSYDNALTLWETRRSIIATKLEAYFTPKKKGQVAARPEAYDSEVIPPPDWSADKQIGHAWSDFAHRVTATSKLTESGISPDDRWRKAGAILSLYGAEMPPHGKTDTQEPASGDGETDQEAWKSAWENLREWIFFEKRFLIDRVLDERAKAIEPWAWRYRAQRSVSSARTGC